MISNTFVILSIISLASGLPTTDNDDQSDELAMSNRGLLSCAAWYSTQGDPKYILDKTLKPPCSIPTTFPSTLLGGWTTDPGCDASKQPNTCDLHKGAYGCYRHAFSTTGPGMQACYDQNGQWISDPWKGAGTVDAETPLGDVAQALKHGIVDVAPYYTCCKTLVSPQPFTCNLYYTKRPSGQCEVKPAV